MLELWALVQCFVDLDGKKETYCRVLHPPETIYLSEENCDRARINLYRDGQCGNCKFDPFSHDLVDPGMGKTQVRYVCRKMNR